MSFAIRMADKSLVGHDHPTLGINRRRLYSLLASHDDEDEEDQGAG